MKTFTCIAALAATALATPTSKSLPKVDLGYEIYQATSLNETTNLYSFSNIRYAAPPTGENRFRAPQPPAQNRSSVQVNTPDTVCPQASPLWGANSVDYITQYLMGERSFNKSDFASPTTGLNLSDPTTLAGLVSLIPKPDPRTTEDCLFLDVVVPQQLFKKKPKNGAPVLVWIYGGGYTAGSKRDSYNPAGLLARSQVGEDDGVIYVALNYRLGAFGWLSGPTFQEDGTANAGLHDQRFALEWVQKHIAKFGGDPKRVTVFGESAGGGSIMGQITAYGGNKGPAPFSQAITQSPGFTPVVSANQQEKIFLDYLKWVNVSSIEEARKLPTEALQLANTITVGLASYGGFTYGPAVDGDFLPALPGQLLARGQFDKSLKVMVGHNANEGLLFTPPYSQNTTDILDNLAITIPSIMAYPEVLDYVTNTLYPQDFSGAQAQGYTNNLDRAAAIISELAFTCNTFYLDKAFKNQTYAYLFSAPPALHGFDVPYTFYNANETSTSPIRGVPNPAIAIALQEYITNFAIRGTPNQAGVVPHFDLYGANATVQNLNVTGITQLRDPVANERCNWWQKGLFA
jgi:carboxylesterase type B